MPQDKIIAFPELETRPAFNRARLTEARLAAMMTQTDLARKIGVSPETISNLESGQRQPGPETLGLICSELKLPVSFFSQPTDNSSPLSSPVFFRSFASKTKRQNQCLDSWRAWTGRLITYLGKFIAFPEPKLPSADWSTDMGDNSLTDRTEEMATQLRRTWGIGDGPIANLTRLAESMGVFVIRLDLPALEEVDGFSCWQDGIPLVFLLSKQSAARERLNIAHEILHLIAHRHLPSDAISDPSVTDRLENEAFSFAGSFHLPRATYTREVYNFKMQQFIALKSRWGISIGAQGRRCKELGIMSEQEHTQFRKNLSWNKYNKIEPLDATMPIEQPRMLAQAIEMLKDNNILKGWEIARDLSLPPEKLAIITGLEPSEFENNEAPKHGMVIRLGAV